MTYYAEHGLELAHGDLCGPITLATLRRKRFFLLIVDDHSRYMWLEVLKSKDEVFKYFKKIKVAVENKMGVKLKVFHTDRGGSSTPLSSVISVMNWD